MDFRLPELGEGIYEAELTGWLVKPGDQVQHGQSLMEVMTDKATMEVPAPFTGKVTSLQAEVGQKIKVGDVVLSYQGGDEPASKNAEPRSAPARLRDGVRKAAASREKDGVRTVVASRAQPVQIPESVKAAPSVRHLARRLGIDLTRIHGSGPGGRILLDDLDTQAQATTPAARPAPSEPPPDYGKPGTRIKLQGLRRKIAEHMVQAKTTIPHYTYVDECDVTDLVRLRESLRENYQRAGVKLTYLAFFVKAVVAALKEVPIVNASLDESAQEIVLHSQYHIGIAVSTTKGLIVPVIHDADRKDLGSIAQEIERLGMAARTGKIGLEDLRGGTFTITSIGGIGGLISTPIVNHPEVAILGIGKIVKRPVFDASGNVRPADLVYLSLSCDHRVLDGAVGAAFCNAVIRRLQNPAVLLLPENLI